MKKLLCLLLTAIMLFSLSGCSLFTAQMPDEPLSFSSEAPESNVTLPSTDEIPQSPVTEEINGQAPPDSAEAAAPITETAESNELDEHGSYTSRDDVALYIHTYGRLPENFITKKEAQALGWSGGTLEPYAPGKCIGGTYFGNYEGLLPEKEGRSYTECDIDTLEKNSRGAKRLVFSNDGLIYYTEDHYASFTLLYGEE